MDWVSDLIIILYSSLLSLLSFSESDILISYDTKGVVRMFSNQYGLSWLPVVDCDSLLNQKGDHYYIVGMTHDPNQMRSVCTCTCINVTSLPISSSPSPSTPLPLLLFLSLSLRVILCKGLVYPPVHPRPVMTTIPLTIPLCESNTEKTNIEVSLTAHLDEVVISLSLLRLSV